MAVMRGTNLPEDAVVLNELDATNYAWEFVANWEKKSDTWALRFGPTALGAINGLSGIIINNHYRKKLKLAHYGFLASVIPISIMPAVLTPLFHRHLISTRMLLMKDEACPICYEMRSTAIQFGFGIVYPMVLGPLASLMFTHRYGTARIPDLTEGPKVIYNFIKKLTRPFTGTLAFLTGIQLAASAVITYYEMKNNITLQNEIVEIERKAEAEDRLRKLNR